MAFDPNFCKGLLGGACFTLILQIPSPMLAQSIGLTTLNLVQFSPTYRGVLARTCNEGLSVSWNHLLSDQGVSPLHKQGSLRRAFPRVTRTRCILQHVTSEDTSPVNLAANEHGLAVRVVDFGLESQSSSISPAFGKFEFKKARMAFKFRDPLAFVPKIHGGPAGQAGGLNTGIETGREWRPVAGFDALNVFRQTGVFPTAAKRIHFAENLAFDFNLQGSARYVNHVLMPVIDSASNGQGLGKLGLQLAVLRKQLVIIAGGANPVVPALVLAGIAIDAVRDLCAFEASDCKIRTTGENVAEVIERTYRAGSPIPSETKATFIDATKYIPFAIMSAVVEGMDKQAYVKMVSGG